MTRGGRATIAMLALAFCVPAGCGADREPVAAAPDGCVESWNAEGTSRSFGRHVYDEHEAGGAQVARLEAASPNPNVAAGGACAVIFAVPEYDREYGTVGLVETSLGWAPMQELARDDQGELERIQEGAAEAVNASLFPDGTLESD